MRQTETKEDSLPARLSSEGLLRDYEVPTYRYYPTNRLPNGTRDWARVRLLQACERLKIPEDRWPQFNHFTLPAKDLRLSTTAPAFQPPRFDLLRDTHAQWRKKAVDLFRRHCDAFLETVDGKMGDSVTGGVLTRIERSKDRISPLVLRYEWAARRYCYNEPYRDMSTAEHSPDQIRKAVTKILAETEISGRRERKQPS